MRQTRTQQVVSFFTTEPIDSARTLLEVVTGIVNEREATDGTPTTTKRRGGRRRKAQDGATATEG